MADTNFFDIEIKNHIAWMTLNRPKKRNAMGIQAYQDTVEHFDNFSMDPEVRVIVLKAAGKCFTAGMDLSDLGSLGDVGSGSDAGTRELLRRHILIGQGFGSSIERCNKPVIAASHHYCIGAGIDMLSACDIRIATRDSIFSVREVKMAVAADLGTLQRLPHIVGQGHARELCLTGRDFTADEALDMGFITKIYDDQESLHEAAAALAEEIASNAPLAVQGTKDVMNYSRDNGVYPGLQYVAQKNASALHSDDLIESVMAAMQKRKPVYKGK